MVGIQVRMEQAGGLKLFSTHLANEINYPAICSIAAGDR
jgi:hypothetical protein